MSNSIKIRRVGWRCWDNISNELRQVTSINLLDNTAELYMEPEERGGSGGDPTFTRNLSDIRLSKLIGLIDKNDIVTYGGDIYEDSAGRKFILCCDNLSTWWELLPDRNVWGRDFTPELWSGENSVVGNIYEHPDLLNSVGIEYELDERLTWKENYREYLLSTPWRRRRDMVVRRADYLCEKCGSGKNLHVHHKTYDRLYNEKLDDLVCLCKKCHVKEHKEK